MHDYMKALHLRFTNPSCQAQELEQQINILHKQFAVCLEKPARKMLLQLTDLEDDLKNQVALDGFLSGFRLASGIQRELAEQPPYSFETEDERKAREKFERKAEGTYGEEKSEW